jgi:hypothetical protein
MVDDNSLEPGDLRLLTVDSYLVLPVNTSIRLLVSSTDVINIYNLNFNMTPNYFYSNISYLRPSCSFYTQTLLKG